MQYKEYFLTENKLYKRAKPMTPTGIVVHSTGANNPNLRRYVAPDDGILGENVNGNHWNQGDVDKCVHAFIGYDKDKVVRCYNTLPWEYRTWGCGKGANGSYNKSHIQFELCEDDLTDETYFEAVLNMAIELCTHLCKAFNIEVDNIVSHKEAFEQGCASNHGDPHRWLKKYSWTMDMFRQRVSENILAEGRVLGFEVSNAGN